MNFTVCIKQVPDVDVPAHILNGEIVQKTPRLILNVYDATALEEALVITEAEGGEVDVVLIGPEKAREAIRKALAMGADRGTHILVEHAEQLDAHAVSRILAAYFRTVPHEAILCGKQAQDTDSGLTGTMLAELLSLPYVSNAVGIYIDGNELVVTRQGDTSQEIVQLPVPGLVACSNNMNDPRIPNLGSIMRSKRKPVTTLTLSDLGLEGDFGPEYTPRVEVTSYQDLPARPPATIWEEETPAMVSNLTQVLAEDARVI
ncbi:MAG: electron transfer flavoprotein subunit beta/FixA family protein [Bacteroidota bacterium]